MPCVLIAESNANIARLIRVNLKRQGYRVRVAPNAAEAIGAFFELKPALLIVADDLSQVPGHVLAVALRREGRFADLAVLLLDAPDAAYRGYGDIPRGVDMFLPKPFNPVELIHSVKRLLPSVPGRPTGEAFSI